MSEPSNELGEEELHPPPQGQDIEGIQQQFEQQQTLIAQLKGALQSSKQQLTTKEREIEECAARLSGIKSRTKASKRSSKSGEVKRTSNEGDTSEKKNETVGASKADTPVQEETVEIERERKDVKKSGKNTEKARLLRKKLEENRMRFEQRGKEMSENKRGIEEMVENLRMQLEERDQVIQTLQKGLESSPGGPPFPTQEIHAETVHISPESNVGEQTDKREMYAQIVYKDNKIVELNNRIMELELNVLDLQENLKEKDAVIDARTKAITLMSEDMSRKSKTTLDTLDDTREQMRLMQNNFITLEARMKDEQEHLKKQLEEKGRKLKYVEENHKKLESVRFDLTTNIAELQEKVVHLQSMNSALQRQVEETSRQRESRGEKQDRVEELLRGLEESNRQLLKVKAQHKNKVKSLTKQIESLKKVSESGDEILQLQQRVAELEEDKGNLQLHLVDFDELKATEHSWKQRIQELEEKVKQQNEDLDSHIRALSHLEGEKLNLIEDIQSERLQVSELDKELKQLQSKITEIENLKVTAEMKAVELEELVDILSREKTDLQRENETLTNDRSEYKQLLDTLQQEKSELLEEITTLQALLKESNPGDTDSNRSEFQMVSSNNSDEEKWKRLPTPEETLTEEKHVKDSSNVELYVKLLESELEDARKVISEEKDTILDLKLKLEAKEEEIEMHLEVISKLEQLGREVSSQQEDEGDVNKISEILKELNEMSGDLEEWKKRCSEVEDRLKCLEDEKISLKGKLEEVTNENSLLNSQLSLQKQVSEELVSKLKDRHKIISEKDEIIKELENKIDGILKEKEPADSPKSKEKTSYSDGVEHESLKVQLEELRKVCEDYKNEIAAKDADLLQIKTELAEKYSSLEQTSVAVDSSEQMQTELKEKEKLVEQLRSECQELRYDIEKLSSNLQERTQPTVALPNQSDAIQKLEQLLSEKDTLLSERGDELAKLHEKLKTVSDKTKKFAVNLKAKTVVIQNLEEKEKMYLEHIQKLEGTMLELQREKDNVCGEAESWRLQCVEKESTIMTLSEKIESNLQFQDSIVEQLVAQNKELVTANENLKGDLNATVEKFTLDTNIADENRQLLTSQVSELEKEVSHLKEDLHNKIEEVNFLKEECKKLPSLEEEKKLLVENRTQNEKKNQELIAEIMKKEDELVELSSKLDDLSKNVEIKNEHLEMGSIKFKELEQIIVTKDMQVTALEDRLSKLQNSWSALEAKLQEREAVIESLEQELAKSHSHKQHLEEGLSFIEERRRSIENKFAALGEQLQESDRIKEEAEEHEGELAYRLAALASSEEMLRKRLETLNENNVELTQKVTELTLENENLKKNVVNADNNFKIANKEIERLSACESTYDQAVETIEKLQADLKKRTAEFERMYKEKEQQSSRYIENLELDMKNLSTQLETLESEKRSVMEHCETLNDIKINLEDDIETLQEKVESYHSKMLELESINKQKESELNSSIAVKQGEIMELNKKIQQLEGDLRKEISDPLASISVGIQTQESLDTSDNIEQLKSEMETITKLLVQRELELQSYQNRLLQLQFSKEAGMPDEEDQSMQRRQLENSVVEMQEKLSLKDSQLEDLRLLLESANCEMGNMQLQLANSCKKIEEMSTEMCNLQEIVKSRDIQLQGQMEQISHITNSDKLSQQLECINIDYQTQLTTLQQQNSRLHQELIREKAKNVVSEIVSSAQIHVHEHKIIQGTKSPSATHKGSRVQFDDNVCCIPVKSYTKFAASVEEQMHMEIVPDSFAQIKSSSTKGTMLNFFEGDLINTEITEEIDFSDTQASGTSTRQELVEKLGDLRAELDIVKNEKAHALMKIKELELEVNRLLDVEKQLNDTQGRLEMFVASQGSAELGSEQLSKESSVESECIGERKGNIIHVAPNEDELLATSGKIKYDNVGINPHVQHTPVSEQIDLADPTWTGETLDEEGWGWGEEEARLEEEHMERQKAALISSPVSSELQQHVMELENKIELLEKEKTKITDELKASQVRSGKMLKKLKDLKLKNESLMRKNQEFALKKSNEFGGLDLAIEEELKIRIDSLEKELKECKGERDAVNIEKEGLQRRIEVLTATNERLTEREQQGLDIEFWQNKNKELNNQVESLQWRIEELIEERETDNSANKTLNLQELQEQIGALAADNEQLQSMLEEQRNLRVGAEAALRDLQQFTSLKEANFLQETDMKENYVTLRENYDLLCKEVATLRSHTGQDSLIAENAALRENYEVLSRELEQLRSSSNSDIIAAEYSSMRNNYEAMYNELEELRSRLDVSNTLQANYESLQMAHDKLINEINHMQKEYCSLTEKYEIIVKEKSQIQDEFSEKLKMEQDNYEQMLNQLENKTADLMMKYEKVSMEFSVVSDELRSLKDEIEKYKNAVATMTQEQERLNEENYTSSERYATVSAELQCLKGEVEKYKSIVGTMTQEQEELKEVNYALHEKYETLKTSVSVPSDKTFNEPMASVLFSEETFAPIQLFSKTDKETFTDTVKKSSVETQVHDTREETDLQKQITECRSQILKLEEIKQQKTEELDVLRAMFSSEQEEWANIEQSLSKKVEALEGELEMIKEAAKRESEVRESLMLKEHELSNAKSQLSYMEEVLTKTQDKVEFLEAQLVQKEEEFQNINQNSESQESMIQQIISSKEQELNKLHETLVLMQQEQEELLLSKEKDIDNLKLQILDRESEINYLKLQIADQESEIENLFTIKDQDIQNLKTQMSEIEKRAQTVAKENDLNIQMLQAQIAQNNTEIQNLSQALKDKELQVIELQEVLEAREDEIREAVIQIRDRNIEIQKLKQSSGVAVEDTSFPLAVKDTQTVTESESSQENELDLALYMLHQRDVRCEELTLELMQLLEERDTLQLRLSTAIRINEELRTKISKTSNTSTPLRVVASHSELETSITSDVQDTNEKVVAPIDPEPVTDAAAGEPREDLRVLADKLSQLHSVDYRRDVTLQDEREQRHSEQLMLLQPRGPGVLVESNYTLSRDVQSPSTVLLNWIWGRSTPKVMHI